MFGMPLPVTDHALRACLSALEMQTRHADVQSGQNQVSGQSVCSTCAHGSLNTRSAVIGNMGSEMHLTIP